MIVDSKYAKVFHSDMLTRSKYDELYAVAVNIRDFKEVLLSFRNNIVKDIKKSKLLTIVNNC